MGEKLRRQAFLKGSDDRADLAGVHHVPVELRRSIVEILIHLLPTLGAGQPVAVFDLLLEDVRAVFCYVGFDEKHVLAHVYAVNDGLLARVLADDVLVEEGKGALVRRGCQPDDKGVKVFENLAPDVVYGAVALVHDDAVEEFRGILGVIYDLLAGLGVCAAQLEHGFLLRGFVQLLAFEDGVHALDRADADLNIVGDIGAFQPAHTI